MVADTVTVFLRLGSSPFPIIDSAKAVVSAAGTGTFNILNAVNGQPYYVVLKHRNSIETWSNIGLSFSGDILNYNFTDFIKAYGGNLKLIIGSSPIKYGIFSGDVNQDGTIDASDVSETDNDAYSSAFSGYVRTDVTGDDFVDAADVSIVDNNAFNSVSAVSP